MEKEILAKVLKAIYLRTKSGHVILHLTLDNDMIISRLHFYSPDYGKRAKFLTKSPYKYKENGLYYSENIKLAEAIKIQSNTGNLSNLEGKYIYTKVYQNKYGWEFKHISSTNLIEDFSKELEQFYPYGFASKYPIYEFLKNKNYTVVNNLINLKNKYSDYYVNTSNHVYQQKDSNVYLSIKNIDAIYKKFYENKTDDSPSRVDHYCSYICNGVEIILISHQTAKNSSKTIHSSKSVIYRVGMELQQTHKEYLSKNSN